MSKLRTFAIFAVFGALLLAVAGVACGGKDKQEPTGGGPESITPLMATATPTTPPSTAAAAPTATPTPPPFDGAVARLKIPRFGVDSGIEQLGILASGHLDSPHDPLNTGWYNIYDKPGFGGNAVFSAHVDYYPNILGPFNKLSQVNLGDQIIVAMENGEDYTYQVVRYQRYTVDTIPMGELIWPKDKPAGAEWITLITCGGEFVASRPGGPGEYLDRDVVVAERIKKPASTPAQ